MSKSRTLFVISEIHLICYFLFFISKPFLSSQLYFWLHSLNNGINDCVQKNESSMLMLFACEGCFGEVVKLLLNAGAANNEDQIDVSVLLGSWFFTDPSI